MKGPNEKTKNEDLSSPPQEKKGPGPPTPPRNPLVEPPCHVPDKTPLNRLNQTGGTSPGPIPDDSAAFQMTSDQCLKKQRHRIRRGEMTTDPSNNTWSSSSPTDYIV